jgi:hypothetical protein
VECLLTFLVLLVMTLIATGSAARAHSRWSRRKRAYQKLARRFGGYYVPGAVLRRPSVRLRYGETHALLREAPARKPFTGRCTQIVIDWPDYVFRCEISPQPTEPRPATFWSLPEITIGEPDFDRRFLIRGHDEKDVREFLSEGVRWQIGTLASLFSGRSVYIHIQRGRILIQKPRLIRHYENLEQFVELAFKFYDQVMLTRASGIEFLAANEAQPLGDVICQVCGEEIDSDMVFCRRCKTPHHSDCWHFNGACSVYGCGETKSVKPKIARTSAKPHENLDKVKPR